MFKITKEIEWSAAHRLLDYNGICNRLHGHSYKAVFTFVSDVLDKDGMVIDFTYIKKVVSNWINQHWDHMLILNMGDPIIEILNKDPQYRGWIYPMQGNPTAEHMAQFLFYNFQSEFYPVKLISVEVFEGPKSSAIYEE
jgi:6-pyruvoyltetrahydropterin/6-carboxytetrahydropterin synthase